MDLTQSLARFAGRLLRPVRAGERRLASRQLGVVDWHHIAVKSRAFANGDRIPDAHAGSDGRSPPIRFGMLPESTRELVLLCEDADIPMPRAFVHWIVIGIPPDLDELREGLPPVATPLTNGVQQGRNTMGKDGWIGPMPPPGHGAHHYHFQLFALDRRIDVQAPVDRARVVRAMRGHIIGFGEVVGTYENT